jgi:ABC-type Mn2+/Zn2+ transport system permease subunit
VSPEDLDFTAKVGLLVLLVIFALYKEFLLVSFDTTLARTLRLPGEALRLILLIVLAVTIVTGIQLVGVAMVAALLVTPAATARFFTGQLHRMMVLSALIGALSGVVGIYLAWHLGVAASATIVLTMTALFLLAFLFAPGKGYLWSLLGRSAHTA